MPHGKLEVYVERAVDIKDIKILGKGSPYCTLTTGSQERSTPPVAGGGTRPRFDTKLEFEVDAIADHLTVIMFSKKKMRDADLLGHCRIAFKDAFYHGHVVPVKPYALTRPTSQPGGHIRLSLTFKAKPEPAVPHRPPRPLPTKDLGRPFSTDRMGYPFNPLSSKRGMTEEDSSSQSSDDDNGLAPSKRQYQRPRSPPPGQPVGRRATPPPNTNIYSPLQTWDGSDQASIASHKSAPEEQIYDGVYNRAVEEVGDVKSCNDGEKRHLSGKSQEAAVGALKWTACWFN